MNKLELYNYLDEKKIEFEAIEHEAVFTVEEASLLNLPHPEAGAKNLFLRDKKKKNYYILTLYDYREIRIKDFQEKIGAKSLSFASEDDLETILGLKKGSVTPFGALQDENKIVKIYIDDYFKDKIIAVHPNENTATIILKTNDLVELLRSEGGFAEYINLENHSI